MKNFRDAVAEEIPQDEIHKAFLQRPDIAPLPTHEQNKRWEEHKVHLAKFLKDFGDQEACCMTGLKNGADVVPLRGRA